MSLFLWMSGFSESQYPKDSLVLAFCSMCCDSWHSVVAGATSSYTVDFSASISAFMLLRIGNNGLYIFYFFLQWSIFVVQSACMCGLSIVQVMFFISSHGIQQQLFSEVVFSVNLLFYVMDCITFGFVYFNSNAVMNVMKCWWRYRLSTDGLWDLPVCVCSSILSYI